MVLNDLFSRVDTHLSRFEGLEAAPHGPLKDLLHLVFTLVDAEVTAAVFVTVLLRKRRSDRPNEMQTLCMCLCMCVGEERFIHAFCSCTSAAVEDDGH